MSGRPSRGDRSVVSDQAIVTGSHRQRGATAGRRVMSWPSMYARSALLADDLYALAY
jgi:hypothetical protein